MNTHQQQARIQQLAAEASAIIDRAEAERRPLSSWEREEAQDG